MGREPKSSLNSFFTKKPQRLWEEQSFPQEYVGSVHTTQVNCEGGDALGTAGVWDSRPLGTGTSQPGSEKGREIFGF